MKNFKEAFGFNLHNIRCKKKLTIEAFAEMLELSPRQITRIESGGNFPSAETICRICIALKIELKTLFDFEWFDELMYFSNGFYEKPQIKVIKDRQDTIVTSILPIRGQNIKLKENMPASEVMSFLINFSSTQKEKLIIEVFEKKQRTMLLRVTPDGTMEKFLSDEDLKQKRLSNNDYNYILDKIKMFKNDKNKLEYIKTSIDALENKEALEKVKSILKGIELTQ